MRLGISSYALTWAVGVPGWSTEDPLSAEGLIDRAVGLGVDLVQYADNLPLDDLNDGSIRALLRHAHGAGVDIEVGTAGIGPNLSRYADLAVVFGSPFVRIVIDRGDDRPTLFDAERRLRSFEPIFRDRGLVLAIENHDRFPTRELAGLVTRLGDWTGICLDTVNSLGTLETPDRVIAELSPRAVDLHLKDFVIRRQSHRMGFDVVGAPAGEGALDIATVVAQTARFGVRTAVLEQWTPPQSSIAETVQLEWQWARQSIQNLRDVPDLRVSSPRRSDVVALPDPTGMPSYI